MLKLFLSSPHMQYIRLRLTPTQINTMKEGGKVAINVVLADQGRGRGGANSDGNKKICYLHIYLTIEKIQSGGYKEM